MKAQLSLDYRGYILESVNEIQIAIYTFREDK